MTFFTDSAFERMMVQKPRMWREDNPPAAPKGNDRDERSDRNGDGHPTAYRDLIILPKKKEGEPCDL